MIEGELPEKIASYVSVSMTEGWDTDTFSNSGWLTVVSTRCDIEVKLWFEGSACRGGFASYPVPGQNGARRRRKLRRLRDGQRVLIHGLGLKEDGSSTGKPASPSQVKSEFDGIVEESGAVWWGQIYRDAPDAWIAKKIAGNKVKTRNPENGKLRVVEIPLRFSITRHPLSGDRIVVFPTERGVETLRPERIIEISSSYRTI